MRTRVSIDFLSFLAQLQKIQKDIEGFNRTKELLQEQIYFRNEYIGNIQEACKTTTKHKDLVRYINTQLENSYIEL